MDQRHQLRTGSESNIETDATQKSAAAPARHIETPEDLIRVDRESVAVPADLSSRLVESLRSQTHRDIPRPWWRRWWDGTPRP